MGSKKIGVALGGGIAKGLAHVGVLKVFAREKIPIKVIAGSSIGAIAAGWYALRGEAGSLEAAFLKLRFGDLFPMGEALAGGGSRGMWKGEAAHRLLRDYFGTAMIEDCKVKFAAIATDADTGDEVVVTKGSLADALWASIAAPVLFGPVEFEGRAMIDGSFSNPFPVDRVRELGAECVVGVDVTHFPKGTAKKRGHIARAYRGVSDTVMFLQHQLSRRISPPADIVIRPELEDIDWFAFGRAAEIMKRGEREAEKCLAEIRKQVQI